MAQRTFGWVQNPNVLTTLKKVVAIMVPGSKFSNYIRDYRLPLLRRNGLIDDDLYSSFIKILSSDEIVVGYDKMKGRGGARGLNKNGIPNSKCSGLAQISIEGQKSIKLISLGGDEVVVKKPYTDDWSADGYVRWAISTGLLDYCADRDEVRASSLGEELVATEDGSEEEGAIFTKALLSCPPVIRILSLLDDDDAHTKFELGSKLGFSGELGFTSFSQNDFLREILSASDAEKSKIKSNYEGDSDKYARTIASWLRKMKWVETCSKTVTEKCSGQKYKLYAYRITPKGRMALKRSRGNSSNARIPKIVNFEMLATKASDAGYLRLRRALIIQALGYTTNRTVEQIAKYLCDNGVQVSPCTIIDDIEGLQRIGLEISVSEDGSGNKKVVCLKDKIVKLVIPQVRESARQVTIIKDSLRERLRNLDHRYLALVDLAYSDAPGQRKKSDAREFEIETAALFADIGFFSMRLGDANRPDVIVSAGRDGAIIDNKSYKDGFGVERSSADEMTRYVAQNDARIDGEPPNEWWKSFPREASDFYFLFVTSFLKGDFKRNMDSISSLTGRLGAVVGVDNLLLIAEAMKGGLLEKADFFKMMRNCELSL